MTEGNKNNKPQVTRTAFGNTHGALVRAIDILAMAELSREGWSDDIQLIITQASKPTGFHVLDFSPQKVTQLEMVGREKLINLRDFLVDAKLEELFKYRLITSKTFSFDNKGVQIDSTESGLKIVKIEDAPVTFKSWIKSVVDKLKKLWRR